MSVRIDVKKLGNHWYPAIEHFDPNDISLDPKMEKLLSKADLVDFGNVTVYLLKQTAFVENTGIIEFNEKDILRYLTTDDSFIMNMYINGHQFWISSELYFLLEDQFQLDFHRNLYKIELW